MCKHGVYALSMSDLLVGQAYPVVLCGRACMTGVLMQGPTK